MKLKVKLTIILLIMGLLPILCGTFLIQYKLRKDLKLSIALQFQDISRTLEHSINNILDEHKDSLDFLISLPSFQEQLLEDWDKDSILRNLLLQFNLNHPLFEEIYVTKEQNKQIKYFSSTHPKRTTLQASNYIINISKKEANYTFKSFNIAFSTLHQSQMIKVFIRFEGQDGEAHILQASIKLNKLFKAIQVLHRHNYENISQRKIIILNEKKDVLFSSHKINNKYLSLSIKSTMNSINKSLGTLILNHKKYLYHKSLVSQTKWEVLILKDYEAAFSSLDTIKNYTLTTILFLSLIIILIGNYLATILTHPIDQLIHLSKQISLGNLTLLNEIERNDEIGLLAESMNHMALSIDSHQKYEAQLKTQLQESLDSMETTINTRTNSYLKLVEEHQSLSKMLSHDMGNYLTNISLKFEEISSLLNPKELIDINRLNEEAGIFLKKVLEFCSINDGFLEINLEQISIEEFIEDVRILFSNKLDQKKLSIDDSKVDKNLHILVDREWFLFSVLNNIFSNAIKFSHPNSTINIETKTTKQEIILIITDHGVGIDSSKLQSIFQGGKKISSLGTQNEVGSGFGLILVKKWVEKFQGKLIIESNNSINKSYTKISIYLPNTKSLRSLP